MRRAGKFDITELVPAGWKLADVKCHDPTKNSRVSVKRNGGRIVLDGHETIKCIFKNKKRRKRRKGKIIVKKISVGDVGQFAFATTGTGLQDFNLTTVTQGVAVAMTFDKLDPKNAPFSITETVPNNWTLTNLACFSTNGKSVINTVNSTAEITKLARKDTVICTYTNTFVPPRSELTISKEVTGANRTFTFSGTTPFGNFTLSNGQSITRTNLQPGNFVITETTDPVYSLNSIVCVGNAAAPIIDLNAGTLTIPVAAGEDITCTFANGQVRDPRVDEETRRFVHRRVDNLLTHGPDRARMLRRLQEHEEDEPSVKDEDPLKLSGNPSQPRIASTHGMPRFAKIGLIPGSGNVNGNGADALFGNSQKSRGSNPFFDAIFGQASQLAAGQKSFKFGTSLSELRSKAAQFEAQKRQKKLAAAGFAGEPFEGSHVQPRPGFDFWIEGQFSRYNDNIGGVNREGDFRILYAGVDYVLAPGILVGLLGQIDDTSEDIRQTGERGEIEGTGWMVGPYVGVWLLDNLFFDARAAWGQSDNDIWLQDAANGLRKGSFDTDRWLATATLTGNEHFGPWRVSPQIGLAYGHEEFDTFRNSAGLIVSGGEASIGRLTGTLEVGYRMKTEGGLQVEPHASITGIWNFDSDDLVINGALVNTDDSRGKVEGGVLVTTPQGWSFRAAGNYDGIGGDDFHSYGGSLWISVPLN